MKILRYAIMAGLSWSLIGPSQAQSIQNHCKVLDPELQLSFEGDCVNGVAFGSGIARGKDGAWYEGQFLGGAKTGNGTKRYPTGDIYTGQWKRDKRHGYGRYVFGEGAPWRGDAYEGYWQNDQRHGSGTYIFYPSGDRFKAQWKNGGTNTLGTTTLARRKQTYQAVAASLSQPGTTVCSVTTDGASPKKLAKGIVRHAIEDRLYVDVQTPSVLAASKLEHNPRWDVITEWTQCTH